MTISTTTRKLLWTKAGNRCSYRYDGKICDKDLVSLEDGNDVVTGQECHIVDRNKHTSRFINDFQNVDAYENLILLCSEHHKIIDSDGSKYTVQVLQDMKRNHEKFIADKLSKEENKQIEIKDSIFETEAKNVDEAICMEVNQPAILSNVNATLKAENVKRAVGFSTNQGLSSIVMSCKNCEKIFPFACTCSLPPMIMCPYCKHLNLI